MSRGLAVGRHPSEARTLSQRLSILLPMCQEELTSKLRNRSGNRAISGGSQSVVPDSLLTLTLN